MRKRDVDFAAIKEWAFSVERDEEFGRREEEDPDLFEHEIRSACTLDQLFHLVADQRCLKRRFFASLLAQDLAWVHHHGSHLPFHTSTLQGIMDRATYQKAMVERAEKIYERAAYIEKMRISEDEVLREFADALLHHSFRRSPTEAGTKTYHDCLRLLHQSVIGKLEAT